MKKMGLAFAVFATLALGMAAQATATPSGRDYQPVPGTGPLQLCTIYPIWPGDVGLERMHRMVLQPAHLMAHC